MEFSETWSIWSQEKFLSVVILGTPSLLYSKLHDVGPGLEEVGGNL